ncbi:zinc ribbon domain-containing protein [candidate division KSB1 bacterium]|nr:zinc ribbon domain-containing protein [candidate division KSB1 bacterium]
MNCPKCGSQNPEFAIYCHQCGTQLSEENIVDISQPPPIALTTPVLPKGNGVLALVFGILGIATCLPLSIIAWLLGHGELQKIKMGLISDKEEGLAKVGKILGIIGTILMVIVILLIFFFIVLSLQFGTEYINDLQL